MLDWALLESYWHWVVLVLASMVTFGGYYSFDFPSVLHNQLFRHFESHDSSLDRSNYELSFSLLFSLYSLPNMVLPWIGGIMIDKIGNYRVMIICATLVLMGNVMQTWAIAHYRLNLLLFGRLLFGLGAETLQVCTNTTISHWFEGDELALALALNLSACKLAGVLTDWVSPAIEAQDGIVVSSFTVTVLCAVCFLLTLLLVFSESQQWFLPRHLKRHVHEPLFSNSLSDLSSHVSSSIEIEMPRLRRISAGGQSTSADKRTDRRSSRGGQFPYDSDTSQLVNCDFSAVAGDDDDADLEVDRCIVDDCTTLRTDGERSSLVTVDMSPMHSRPSFASQTSQPTPEEHIDLFEDLRSVSLAVWIMMSLTFVMYGTFIPFSNISNAVIVEVFFVGKDIRASELAAARYQSIPYFLTVFLNPVIGWLVDKFGRRPQLLIVSATILCLAHLLIYFAPLGALLPLLLIGVSYSVFASVIWPCVPLSAPEAMRGTVYGMMAAFQNCGQFVMPLVLQAVYRHHHHFRTCELFLASLAFCAVVLAVALYRVDFYHFNSMLQQASMSKNQ